MEHFFAQQWKDQGIYHLIKLFDRPLVMDRSLLAAALCFWSSATNTINFRFGMMTQTGLAGISFQLQKGMTVLTLTPWSRRNAYDEDGRVCKVKKGSTGPPRPSTPAVAVPKVTAPPLTGAAVAASTAAPTPKATAVVGARKTLTHRTVPSSPPVRPSAVAAPGRKRGREAPSTEAAPAQSAVAKTAALERRPRT
ncbi:uncharacterized protein Pyn_15640 [Prunus yedoensis var. nudiflora]|uniref:Aminotransferase-like plant mobile domain-containing protein n=1 Tax=Prunus yedoensis var. nudiflora TaxID=2094558 RepID=A0A314ZAU0_PRUYE|nr:uncharacterized protein Pyn_15640 [Prunus yedoensis var. nudiflora]